MIKRIESIIRKKNLSASKFADEVGVQRSSVSHVLSGRNKPSLDFIQKILLRYPEINAQWLITGKGSYDDPPTLFTGSSEIERKEAPEKTAMGAENAPIQSHENGKRDEKIKHPLRIVMFYDDDSFEEYHPKRRKE